MNHSEINFLQDTLGIELPLFYVESLLNYPFSKGSFGEEFMLVNDVKIIQELNDFAYKDKCFAIGSDGGEFIYYINLNGEETVYIFDLENHGDNLLIEARSWQQFIENIEKIHLEIEEDENRELERKKNKKWWQFWI